jgi:hypothetical protein
LPLHLLSNLNNRHTHGPNDSCFANYTVPVHGTNKRPGLAGGVHTLDHQDEIIKSVFPKAGEVTITRFEAVFNLIPYFAGQINFGNYRPPHKESVEAISQGKSFPYYT